MSERDEIEKDAERFRKLAKFFTQRIENQPYDELISERGNRLVYERRMRRWCIWELGSNVDWLFGETVDGDRAPKTFVETVDSLPAPPTAEG